MKALVLRREESGFIRSIEEISDSNLEKNATLITLEYSSLNYKDALAITNRSPVVRAWPMVAGIDGAGRISSEGSQATGVPVVVTGWGLGETRWGCLAEKVAVERDWPVALPAGLSLRDSMAVGTAGLTAMLCIMALERCGIRPEDGPVLVTGASGGVGGMALVFLKSLGFQTVASTGRLAETDYLASLGATEVIDRKELSEPGKPLQKERWAAVIDSVGSHTLANACAQTRYGGVVAACGLAQGMDFPATVAPFILRGVTLAGVDSVMAPPELRQRAWDRISTCLDRQAVATMTREITLEEVIDAAEELLAGNVRGRLIVNLGK